MSNLAVNPHYITKLLIQYLLSEAVVQRCSVKKVLLESSQSS